MFYSAGSQNAWASVYHIQNVVPGGWVLRGIHHFMAQAMVVLLPLHMLQVIWEKAVVERCETEDDGWSPVLLPLAGIDWILAV